jgi:fumarate hydratase subunit beta
MSEIHHITSPLTEDVLQKLRVGQRVLLSGTVYTARDAAHQRLVQTLAVGQPLPFDLRGQIIYYVGPSPTRPGQVIGAAGPTTAGRVDDYTLPLLAQGLKGMIGKGKRSQAVRDGLVQYKAVYCVCVGGAAALLSERITAVQPIAYEDLGTEAIRQLTLQDFPMVVADDIYGADMYEQCQLAYRRLPHAKD